MHTRAIQTLLTGLILMVASTSLAQQNHAISWDSPNGASEYAQDFRIDVGDVPGHIVRTFEIIWQPSMMDPTPSFNGVEVVSMVSSGLTDYFNFNGIGQGYYVFTLETGDQVFSEWTGNTQTSFLEDGSPNASTFSGVVTITGGTGAFTGIRGLVRQNAVWNLATDQSKVEPMTNVGEYWFVNDMQ